MKPAMNLAAALATLIIVAPIAAVVAMMEEAPHG